MSTDGRQLRAVEADEGRCVALTSDVWASQCELPSGHDGLHWCRGFAGAPEPRRWKTGAKR